MTKIATIHIKDLRLRTFIGIKEDEINNKQDVIVNILIRYDASAAINRNAIEEALNYRTITKEMIAHVESNRFALLEKLTADLVSIAMGHTQVLEVQVEVDKPHALRFADSVSIALSDNRYKD